MANTKRARTHRAGRRAAARPEKAAPARRAPKDESEESSGSRAFWSGSISFGLLQIPVGVYTAEIAHELSFRQLDRNDLSPIGYERVNKGTGKAVAWEDIVKGYEYEKGEYVVVTDEELKRANVEATQTIDLQDFVDMADIDPIYFEKPYYLSPLKRAGKAYGLLREALVRTKKAAIATVVMRTRQHLCAIIPRGDVLVLEVLRFAHELRPTSSLHLPSTKAEASRVSAKELEMAVRLVDGMSGDWDPEKYHDTFRDDVLKLIETKARTGRAPRVVAPKKKRAPAGVDLMSILQRSVANASKRAVNDNAPARAKRASHGRSKKAA